MLVKYETFKFSLSSITAALLALLGKNYKVVTLLIVFMAVDTFFGHLRAARNKEWKSYNARWGLIGKLVELVLIMLMYLCEWTFNIDWLVNVVTIYFIICEAASIAENIVKGHLNDNIPADTIEFLEKMQTNFLTKFKEWLRDFFGGGGNNG